MKLSQLLEELSFTEFSNLAVGENGSGRIEEKRIPSVVSSINGALLRLYSKFLQNHKVVIIKKLAGIEKYVISSEHAESKDAPVPYVMDEGTPFLDDILKIISVHYRCPRTNEFFPVESRWRHRPITVDVPRTLNVPDTVPVGELIYVRYRASHRPVVYEDDTDIECPPSAYEAIKAYVAYKEYTSMNTETGVAKGQEYYALFNTICAELEDRDTIGVVESFPDHRFEQRGFP